MGNVKGSYIARCALATVCALILFCITGNIKPADAQTIAAGSAVQTEPAAGTMLGEGGTAAVEQRDFDDPDSMEHENLRGERGEFEEPEEHEYGERQFREHDEEFPDEEFFGWSGDDLYGIPDEEFFEGPQDDFIRGPGNEIYEDHQQFDHPNEYFEWRWEQGFEQPWEWHSYAPWDWRSHEESEGD